MTELVVECGWGLWCTNHFKPTGIQLPLTGLHACVDCGEDVHNLCCQAMHMDEGVFKCGDCVGEEVWYLIHKPSSFDALTGKFDLA